MGMGMSIGIVCVVLGVGGFGLVLVRLNNVGEFVFIVWNMF